MKLKFQKISDHKPYHWWYIFNSLFFCSLHELTSEEHSTRYIPYVLCYWLRSLLHMVGKVKLTCTTKKIDTFLLANLVKKYPIWIGVKMITQTFWTSFFWHVYCDWGGFFDWQSMDRHFDWSFWLVEFILVNFFL